MVSSSVRSCAQSVVAKYAQTGAQLLVAIVGPPATGKSTFSAALSNEIIDGSDLSASVVPMDGFHLDNIQLDRLGLQQRKGCPESFDVAGLRVLLGRLKSGEFPLYYPIFDRSLDKAIAGAGVISDKTDIVIIEGNYLLLDEDPWKQLSGFFDYSIYLDTPFDELETRLVQRWLGYGHTRDQANKKALSNDIPNARRVAEHVLPATTTLRLSPRFSR